MKQQTWTRAQTTSAAALKREGGGRGRTRATDAIGRRRVARTAHRSVLVPHVANLVAEPKAQAPRTGATLERRLGRRERGEGRRRARLGRARRWGWGERRGVARNERAWERAHLRCYHRSESSGAAVTMPSRGCACYVAKRTPNLRRWVTKRSSSRVTCGSLGFRRRRSRKRPRHAGAASLASA